MASNPALIRQELNLKNLRRHDSSIEEIVASTAYTTVYYNTGESWVKTNIEGPMFLFRRSVEPTYGFFILNRNGLEYVHELLTPDSEVRMEGEFILYEPHAEADRATGIWVWEEKERVALCARMEELRVLSCPPPIAAAAPYTATQSTPLDFLFASSLASPPAPAAAIVPTQPQGKPTGMQLLDSIFKSANPPPPPPTAPTTKPEPPRDARALLALIGHPTALVAPPQAVAAPNPLLALRPQLPQQQQRPPVSQQQTNAVPQQQQPRSAPQQQQQPSPQQQRPPPIQPSPQQQRPLPLPVPASTQPTSVPTSARPKPPAFAPPLLSHDVFALPLPKKVLGTVGGAAALPKPAPAPSAPARPPPAPSAPAVRPPAISAPAPPRATAAASAPRPLANSAPALLKQAREEPVKKALVKAVPTTNGLEKETALGLLDTAALKARLGMRRKVHEGEVEPLDKNEFVREVMGLLQKSAFTTALYSGYLRRFSEEMEEEERGRGKG